MFWALKWKSNDRSTLDGSKREGPHSGTELDRSDLNSAVTMINLPYEQAPVFETPEGLLKVIRIMTSTKMQQRPSADTVWHILGNSTHFGQVCGVCCLPEAARDNANFTVWTRPPTFPSARTRDAFDTPGQLDSALERVLYDYHTDVIVYGVQQDLASVGSEAFDWTGQNRSFHVVLKHEEEVPIVHVRMLGLGHSAIVGEVACNGKMLARKTFALGKRRAAQIKQLFEHEVNLMRQIRHQHVVQVVGSYSTS
jgi:hypothetical protein